MQFRKYGNTGKEVSLLGFGCMRFPKKNDKIDQDETIRIVHRAIELGVNHFDTARGYGDSELVLGKALQGKRDSVLITTKNPNKSSSGDEWQKVLETSLETMQCGYFDFYLSHYLSWEDFQKKLSVKDGPIERAMKLKEQKLISHFGFSSHDTPENMIRLIDTGYFECITLQYNFMDLNNEKVIKHATAKGLGVTVMGPLAGGRIAGIKTLAREINIGKDLHEVELGLRFVFSNKDVSNAISGMNTMEQVEQNVAIASNKETMNKSDKKALLTLLEKYKKIADLYCTGCNYCMPCPSGVNIQYIFYLDILYNVYGCKSYAASSYQNILKNYNKAILDWSGKPAACCVECGQCETKCPQKIKIIEQLKKSHATLSENCIV